MFIKRYIKISITLIIAFFYFNSYAQRWDVPTDKKAKNSYFKFTIETSKEGESKFTKNCQSCHGNIGKDNALKTLKPIPPDLASAKTQELTDGELFYIITTGRMVMPSFKNIFSEDEIWKIISYVRSFNNKYVQTLSKFDPNKSKLVKIVLDYNAKTNKIIAKVNVKESSENIPLKDAEITLFVKRYFGRLQIDKTIRTNNEGYAAFDFPKDLPGDTIGNLNVIVKINDENYGEVIKESKLQIGVPTDKPGLTEKRAIWNVLKKAPIWIIITYTSLVLAVMSILIYIIFNIFKINKLGNN